MKKIVIFGVTVMMASVAPTASALEGGMNFGKNFSSLNLGLGTDTPGLGLSGGWLRSEHDGKIGNIGLSYGIGGETWMISPGVKLLRTVPKDSKEGYAASAGADLRYSASPKIGLFASYYWSPEAWSEHTDGLREADAGLFFRPVSLLDVRVGYKYAALEGKNGSKDNVISDGVYVGGGIHF